MAAPVSGTDQIFHVYVIPVPHFPFDSSPSLCQNPADNHLRGESCMHHFQYRGDQLMCEEVSIERIAEEVGTPFYLYSHATLTHHFRTFDQAFAGIPPSRIVFAGVGKTREEMEFALKSDILMFNVESPQELRLLNDVARAMGTKARVALRINPGRLVRWGN